MSEFVPFKTLGGINSDQGRFRPLGVMSGNPPAPEPLIGIQGETGVGGGGAGATGPAGPTGPSGGPVGATGVQGVQGQTGVGVQGVQGATGIQGVPGPSLTSMVAAANGGGSFSTSSDSFVPIPGTLISFSLPSAKTVFFSGFATADPDPVFDVPDAQIGLRVDGTDYPGTLLSLSIASAFLSGPLTVTNGLFLGSGPHSAQLVLLKPGLSPATVAMVETSPGVPAVLTLVF